MSLTCRSCQDNGISVSPATRVINGRGWCEPCWRKREGISQSPVQEQEDDGQRRKYKRSKDIDWKAVQKDRDAAMTGREMAAKHGISMATIYNNTTARQNIVEPRVKESKSMAVKIDRNNGDMSRVDFTDEELRQVIVSLYDAAERMTHIGLTAHKRRAAEYAELAMKLDKTYAEDFPEKK